MQQQMHQPLLGFKTDNLGQEPITKQRHILRSAFLAIFILLGFGILIGIISVIVVDVHLAK